MLIAAVDQGSSSTKGALLDADGGTVARAAVTVESRSDGPRVEQDPEELAASVERVLDELGAAARAGAVALTCQRSTCLLWEREGGGPLTAALSWRDRREADRVDALAGHAARVGRITGLRLSPHYAAPKLAGLLDALPAGRRRAADGELVAGTLDAFLVHRLTGLPSTEPGHAGRTLLHDLEADAWSDELCDLFGVPREALPQLLPSAGERGSWRGLPVVALAGDQQAALLGQGGWQPGVAAVHFGTGAFVLAATGTEPKRHDGLLTAVLAATAAGPRYQIEGSVNAAGHAVDHACRLTGVAIRELADRSLDTDRLPRVLPTITGAAAPWWRPRATGVVAGLAPEHDGHDLVAATVAGVVHRVVDCIEALREAGAGPELLRAGGRLTRLSGLVDLLADVGRVPVEVSADEEAGLAGVARLARAGLAGEESLLLGRPEPGRRREPGWSPERAEEERRRWREFAAAALALGEVGRPA